MELHEQAYECKDIKCECHKMLEKHCPICNQLYLWDIKNPKLPCTECEDML